MGREATCQVQWAAESGRAKVLLETHDLIVRGAIRRTVPIASLRQVAVSGDELRFHAGSDPVTLTLGAPLAESWARKIATPPPALAAKLGITAATNLGLIGEFESEELRAAIAQAGSTEARPASLILASVRTAADLNYALDIYAGYPNRPPLWLVYPKGANKPLSETEIRSTLRHQGFMDVKVASVNATLTALKFVKRS